LSRNIGATRIGEMSANHSVAITDTPIDRISPTVRPTGWRVMRQRWADLLFLHWEVDPAELRAKLPSELTLDLFDGRAFVGLVPFTMTGIRLPWAPPVLGLSSFHEVNLRTYVHRDGRDPGVWFFSLDAANSLAVLFARRYWKLPYHRANIQLKRAAGGAIHYTSERLWPGPTPARCEVRYQSVGDPAPAALGSLDNFLAERYILYANAEGGLYSGRVHHRPYPLQPALVELVDESLFAAAGLARPLTEPLAHYAGEVRVGIYPLVSTRKCRA
jgi:uncharacterized protein YqjF (DUF2071 family)